jgi:hypothetical protein
LRYTATKILQVFLRILFIEQSKVCDKKLLGISKIDLTHNVGL